MYTQNLALNNLQGLICPPPKNNKNNQPIKHCITFKFHLHHFWKIVIIKESLNVFLFKEFWQVSGSGNQIYHFSLISLQWLSIILIWQKNRLLWVLNAFVGFIVNNTDLLWMLIYSITVIVVGNELEESKSNPNWYESNCLHFYKKYESN